MTPPARHKWREVFRDERKTERACQNPGCSLLKVTRHEPAASTPHWVEFWCDLERVECGGTPACPHAKPEALL